jgi:hypothetical protein
MIAIKGAALSAAIICSKEGSSNLNYNVQRVPDILQFKQSVALKATFFSHSSASKSQGYAVKNGGVNQNLDNLNKRRLI